MGNPTRQDFEQLRRVVDGNDQFMRGSSVAGKARSRHAERMARTPEWVHSDLQVRQLLLTVFPKLETDERQRKRAATWILMIQYYFRMGLTQGRIAINTGWTLLKVNRLIHRIRSAAAGLRADTRKPRSGRRGRPRTYSL